MNLLPTVIDKVELFDNEREITLMLVDPNVQNADDDTKGAISEMFLSLTDTSPDIKFEWLTDVLRSIAYYNEHPPVFRVYQGENFSIRIELEEGRDFSNYVLTIRRADDHTLLSPDDTDGDSYANAPVQYAYINNLTLSLDEFFKVHVLVENTDGTGAANGDAVTLLTNAYLIVTDSIDA
jgi:hypothetical protein